MKKTYNYSIVSFCPPEVMEKVVGAITDGLAQRDNDSGTLDDIVEEFRYIVEYTTTPDHEVRLTTVELLDHNWLILENSSLILKNKLKDKL